MRPHDSSILLIRLIVPDNGSHHRLYAGIEEAFGATGGGRAGLAALAGRGSIRRCVI